MIRAGTAFVLFFFVLSEISRSQAPSVPQQQRPPQPSKELVAFLKDHIGLNEGQIANIDRGRPVAKIIPSKQQSEVLVFGAIFVKATPEEYIRLSFDMNRLRNSPSYLGAGRISDPPKLPDLQGFTLEPDDISSLRACRLAKCGLQLPAEVIPDFHTIATATPPGQVYEKANLRMQEMALDIIRKYQKGGNTSLPIYSDSSEPFDTNVQFRALLARSAGLHSYLRDLTHYLLNYPASNPPNAQSIFFWEKVNFGLKPTIRVNHSIAYRADASKYPTHIIAVKQLYASHYLQLALDLTACVPDHTGATPGFYLLSLKGSSQQGLTGFTGSIMKRIILSRARSSQEQLLSNIKHSLETGAYQSKGS